MSNSIRTKLSSPPLASRVSTARRPCPPGSRVLKLSARPVPLRGTKEEKRKNVNVLTKYTTLIN